MTWALIYMQITLLGFICRYGEITTQANSKNYRALSREITKILKMENILFDQKGGAEGSRMPNSAVLCSIRKFERNNN